MFLFTTTYRPSLESTKPPTPWIPGSLSLGVKRQDREAEHSSSSSAEVKNLWSYQFAPPIRPMAWCSFKRKHRDIITFTFYLVSVQ
jgi:hypothetical protein